MLVCNCAFLLLFVAESTVDAPEYCMNEMFQARCARDEVIVMKSAFYGRMHISRCVTVDMGYLGCSSDVLDLADQRCSGRRECELRMPYPAFEETRPCYDLQSFFKADFYCLKGRSLPSLNSFSKPKKNVHRNNIKKIDE